MQAIIDSGVLRVGVKNAVIGFGYEDPATGEYTGMEIDIANKIAEALGVEVEFTPVTAATRTELLDAGDIDCVLATFTITDERKQSWDFTTPYYTDHVTRACAEGQRHHRFLRPCQYDRRCLLRLHLRTRACGRDD